jgi:hypothetical protein
MRALVRLILPLLTAALVLAGCGGGDNTRPAAAPTPTPTPGAAQLNRDAKAPEIVHVYKVQGDDPYPWTLTVRTDNTANLIVGGGHGGGDDKLVRLPKAVTERAKRLTAAVPWKRIANHTVDTGGFGGNDNMARYMLRWHKISTVYAAGDMPWHLQRLVTLLDHIIDEDIGTIVASQGHHSSNGGILDGATN